MGAPPGRGATRKHIIGRTRHGHGVLETHRGERRGGPGSWKNDPQSRLAPQSDDGIIAESHRQQTHTRTCTIMRAFARDSVELRALASTRMRAHPAFQPIGRMCPDHLTNQRVFHRCQLQLQCPSHVHNLSRSTAYIHLRMHTPTRHVLYARPSACVYILPFGRCLAVRPPRFPPARRLPPPPAMGSSAQDGPKWLRDSPKKRKMASSFA